MQGANKDDILIFMNERHCLLHFCVSVTFQGLSDAEESVVVAAIEAMISLTELGLFPTHLQCDLLTHTAPLLIHPNLWIRQVLSSEALLPVFLWENYCKNDGCVILVHSD